MEIIVSDIFACTPELKELADEISPQAIILNPYQGIDIQFNVENGCP